MKIANISITQKEKKYSKPFLIKAVPEFFNQRYSKIYGFQKEKYGKRSGVDEKEVRSDLRNWTKTQVGDIETHLKDKVNINSKNFTLYEFLKKEESLSHSSISKKDIREILLHVYKDITESSVINKSDLLTYFTYYSNYGDPSKTMDNRDIPFRIRRTFIHIERQLLQGLFAQSQFFYLFESGIKKIIEDKFDTSDLTKQSPEFLVSYKSTTNEFSDVELQFIINYKDETYPNVTGSS